MTTSNRLYFLDNLRVALTVGVIAHHAAQAYGPTGGFWPLKDTATAAILKPFFVVNRSFAMSLFFLIAGYFTVAACDARGPHAFITDRLRKLGIPMLGFAGIIYALQVFVFHGGWWPINVGHTWFVEHLLILSIGYALWRMARKAHNPDHQEPVRNDTQDRGNQSSLREVQTRLPSTAAILAFGLLLAVVTATIRRWYPIDQWVHLLGFVRVAWADVPRDVSFYFIGLLAYRRNWLLGMPSRTGRAWLWTGIGAVAFAFVYAGILEPMLPMPASSGELIYAIWEKLLALGLCIGLVMWFRDRVNVRSPLMAELARSQYMAFLVHVFVVMAFQAPLLGVALPPLVKFGLVTLFSVPVTFVLSSWLRRPLGL